MGQLEDIVTDIQMLYPRIYMACHVDHIKARSSESKISARDSSILAHLSVRDFQRSGTLAKHLEITPSTLSEALHNLVSLGFVSFKTDPNDERRTEFKLTEKGVVAMKNSSVLDSSKVAFVLGKLSEDDRNKVTEGMRIFADAAIR